MKMPAELYNFALASIKDNNYYNIYFMEGNDYSLRSIDNFTSNFTKDELYEYLFDNKIISDKDTDLEIIYKGKDIDDYKVLNEGLLYKENKVDDMVLAIEELIKNNKDNHILLRDMFKNIRVNRLIDDYIKKIFEVVFLNKHLEFDELKGLLDELYLFDKLYVDLRTAYMVVNNTYEKSLDKPKVKVLH